PSTDADVAALAGFYIASVQTETASWECEPPSIEEFVRRRKAILDQGFPYFTAEVDGRVAGYAYASSYRSRIGYRYTVEDSVYVDPAMKGRGIGKALLRALIAECETRGYRQMIAVIGDSANLASIRLHESCGFETAGVFRNIGFKFERWLDSVQMQRSLGAGSQPNNLEGSQ
ncbi:MAG: N-acetyltransferase, partial [Betaproteobacteria bacterium]|nr:N-acetyltransferase [Betaproteobacteria bacterium]